LGLDPVTLLGGDVCSSPFNRIVVKTRSSDQFTAELKDFVAPTDLFLAPRAQALSETPSMCDIGGIAEIHVTNPVSTSVYQWYTTDGNIVTSPATGPSIYVDQPGTYIVRQYLQAGCSIYATDTVQVLSIPNCVVLDKNFLDFRGELKNDLARLNWKVVNNQQVKYFEIQRSGDGINFVSIDNVNRQVSETIPSSYSYQDDVSSLYNRVVYYRIKLVNINSVVTYSNIATIPLAPVGETRVTISPNPVKDMMQLHIWSKNSSTVRVELFDQSGKKVSSRQFAQKGRNIITLDDLANKSRGIYIAIIYIDDKIFRQRILLAR
jgi:hypothetical protein